MSLTSSLQSSKSSDKASPGQLMNKQMRSWLLLCYLDSQGISIRSVLITGKDRRCLLQSIQGWFKSEGQLLAEYEMQTHRELVWIVRGRPLTANEDEDAALRALRSFAISVMSADIKDRLGSDPHYPFSASVFKK